MKRPAATTAVKAVIGLLLMTLVVISGGCGASSDTEDLRLSLRETRTAVRSTELALDLLGQGRTTRAAAQVTAGDMVDQISLAQQRLADAPGDTAELRELRRPVSARGDRLVGCGSGHRGRPLRRRPRLTSRCRVASSAARCRRGPGGGGGAVKRLFAVALGILTAIGGFLDIGDIVTNAVVGSRFGMSLAWVVVVGVIGICVFAQMSGRVAAVSGRATFEIIRERLGPRAASANLAASFLINLDDAHR